MRKGLIAFGLTITVAFLGMLSMGAVNAYSRDNGNDILELNLSQHGMMGSNYSLYSFERIYLHLSTDNQEKLDSGFANELITTDIQQKTVVEVVEIIEQIKLDIIDDVQIEYSTQRFGMMGGNMMGYGGNDPYANCGYQNNASTYEWLYIHSSDAQRDSLDLQFAEAIMNLDLSKIIKKNQFDDSIFYWASYNKHFTIERLIKILEEKRDIIHLDVTDDMFDSIRLLRNSVMHHNLILFSYKNEHIEVNKEIDNLENKISLLWNLLDDEMKKSFEKGINMGNYKGGDYNNQSPNLKRYCLRRFSNGVFIKE